LKAKKKTFYLTSAVNRSAASCGTELPEQSSGFLPQRRVLRGQRGRRLHHTALGMCAKPAQTGERAGGTCGTAALPTNLELRGAEGDKPNKQDPDQHFGGIFWLEELCGHEKLSLRRGGRSGSERRCAGDEWQFALL